MNRTLIAVAVGLFLGAVLFGMLQRDQDADAGTDIAHPHAAAPGHFQHPGDPASRRGGTQWGQYQGTGVRAPEMPRATDPDRISSLSPEAQQQRVTVAQEWQERRAARQRELAERRKQLAEQQRAQMNSVTTSGSSRPQGDIATQINSLAASQQGAAREMLADMLTPEGESQEVAAAREAFRDQLSEFRGPGGDPRAGGDAGGSLPGAGEGPAGPLEALAALAASDPGNPGLASAIAAIIQALGTTKSINGKFINSLPPGFPNVPGLPPIPGLPGGPEEDPLVVVAEWFPVESRGCEGLPYSRVNDLYLRVNKPFKLLNISSNSARGLRVVGGEFLQNPLGGNVTPSDPNSCVAIDSFLAMGSAMPTSTSSAPFLDVGSSQVVNANWLAFADDGTPGIVPSLSQPGNRRRIWIGRFAVSGNPESVSGTLTAFFLNPESVFPIPTIVNIEIPHEPEQWQLGGPPPPPGLGFFDIAQSQITAGLPILVDINLKKAAPFGGTVVELESSHPSVVRIPASVTIPAGASSVELGVRTRDVDATTRVTLTARTGANQPATDQVEVRPRAKGDVDSSGVVDGADLASMLAAWNSNNPFVDFNNDGTVNGADLAALLASWTPPPGVQLLSFSRPEVKAGESFQLTIRITRPATAGGVDVTLISSLPEVIDVPAVVTIPEGATTTTLIVTTSGVNTDTSVSISAEANGVLQAASILIRSTVGDVDGDGSVDGSDLASLLASWGGENVSPTVDFDGNGEVDGADLAALLSHWTGTIVVPPGEGPVVAKWIPVAINEECAEELAGIRTADLYLGFEESLLAPAATIIQSAQDTGLRIENGVFHHDPDVNENRPPVTPSLLLFPCTEFDSYLTVGETEPFFTPDGNPGVDWGTELVAEWLSGDFSGASIEFETDFEKFGDSRIYLRIGRISATEGASYVGGDLLVRYTPSSAAGSIVAETVTVENCPECWADLDLNQDGVVDDADIDALAALMGTDAQQGDFDANGVVDGLDLQILVDAITAPN